MFDYLAFIYSGISEPSGDALSDGKYLADQCLQKLVDIDNQERFPPKLLILLASPAYLDHQEDEQKAERLLKGVYETFSRPHKDIQLIGSSVGAVFFDRQVHSKGALLICLASRLIEARVAFGLNARQKPKSAIDGLLKDLKLDSLKQIDPNPLANRLILTFMPGCNQTAGDGGFYPAPELHRRLYDGVQARITLVGGVSSANDASRKKDGLQFAQQRVLRDSVVAADIITGVPIGVSLSDGFSGTGDILRVTKLGENNRTVVAFDERLPKERMMPAGADVILVKVSDDNERIVDIPLPGPDGSVQLLRPCKLQEYFQIRQPKSEIFETLKDSITQAKQRVFVKRPIASLWFPCKAYNLRRERGTLDFDRALIGIEEELESRPCVGGFFDGELGVDEKGRSRLTNGGVGCVIFGDEIRERTALYQGVSTLAELGPEFLAGSELTPDSYYEAIAIALNIVYQTGFPGAMISLVHSSLDRRSGKNREFIVGCKSVGSRFDKIRKDTKRPCEDNDILAIVVRAKQAQFIPNSLKEPSCDDEAVKVSGVISQYILPLKRLDKTVFGTLQVDVGDLSHLSPDEFRETEKARMLDCLGEVIGAGISRIASAIKNKIMLRLDRVLKENLSAGSVHEGLDRFVQATREIFAVEMGHLRLVKSDDDLGDPASQTLVLQTGFGACYEAEKESRREIQKIDGSPICHAVDSDEPEIINEVGDDPAFQSMLTKSENDKNLHDSLKSAKAYAAVGFKGEGNKPLGAISFGSNREWFFLRFHQEAFVVLAERLVFLVEHLRAKVRLKFLFDVSPRFAERNLDQAETILEDIVKVFSQALDAEVASLYLWEQDRKKFILRAQHGWEEEGWEHAASYRFNAGWIGVRAVKQKPLYEPDLHRYYEEHATEYKESGGQYAKEMFGESLSDTFTVEAIGLPLRIGPGKTDKFGVLTLYRRITPGHASGFKTTDIQLLQEGAYDAAGLVSLVMRHREDMWEKDEDKRLEEVYQAINSNDEGESFEGKVCREVLKSFHASEVSFYRIDELAIEPGTKHSWIAGYLRPRREEIVKLHNAPEGHLKIIQETFEREGILYPVAFQRHRSEETGRRNPAALATNGQVELVCIPLVGENNYLAALVVSWKLSHRIAFSRAVRHETSHLQRLGHIIGSAYLRLRMREQAERDRLAVQTAGIYVFQHAHKLGNAIQSLYSIAKKIESTEGDERTSKLEELKTTATNNIKMVEWVIDLGQHVQKPAKEPISLYGLLQESWEEVAAAGNRIHDVTLPAFTTDEEITVITDPRLTKEVFVNLIENALSAAKRKQNQTGEKPKLEVTAVVSEDKETVVVTFKDNGIGMTLEQIDAAKKGFVPTEREFRNTRHKGVGVLISVYLLSVQDSSLSYESVVGKGTEAVVRLPHFRMVRRKNGVGKSD
jgi:signal transduction histidine kinase